MAKTVRLKGGGFLRVNLDRLKAIEEQLGRRYVARVGILGDKSRMRKGEDQSTLTNAEIGLIQEKGSISRGIPARSFLMMPLTLRFDRYVPTIGMSIMQGVTTENIKFAYAKMGTLAVSVIDRAFASRGFGQWEPNAPATIARKKSDAPLIDTSQLRKSITSTVVSV